ncbi:hypothetical protein EJB05_41938, partial [Eragrostis curvula]
MANPRAAMDPPVPAGLLRRAVALPNRRRRPRLQVRLQLILDSAVLLIAMAWSFVIYSATKPSAIDDPVFFLVAFVLFLLGVWLALLGLVAHRFPRAARVGEAIARTLRDYMFGGAR